MHSQELAEVRGGGSATGRRANTYEEVGGRGGAAGEAEEEPPTDDLATRAIRGLFALKPRHALPTRLHAQTFEGKAAKRMDGEAAHPFVVGEDFSAADRVLSVVALFAWVPSLSPPQQRSSSWLSLIPAVALNVVWTLAAPILIVGLATGAEPAIGSSSCGDRLYVSAAVAFAVATAVAAVRPFATTALDVLTTVAFASLGAVLVVSGVEGTALYGDRSLVPLAISDVLPPTAAIYGGRNFTLSSFALDSSVSGADGSSSWDAKVAFLSVLFAATLLRLIHVIALLFFMGAYADDDDDEYAEDGEEEGDAESPHKHKPVANAVGVGALVVDSDPLVKEGEEEGPEAHLFAAADDTDAHLLAMGPAGGAFAEAPTEKDVGGDAEVLFCEDIRDSDVEGGKNTKEAAAGAATPPEADSEAVTNSGAATEAADQPHQEEDEEKAGDESSAEPKSFEATTTALPLSSAVVAMEEEDAIAMLCPAGAPADGNDGGGAAPNSSIASSYKESDAGAQNPNNADADADEPAEDTSSEREEGVDMLGGGKGDEASDDEDEDSDEENGDALAPAPSRIVGVRGDTGGAEEDEEDAKRPPPPEEEDKDNTRNECLGEEGDESGFY